MEDSEKKFNELYSLWLKVEELEDWFAPKLKALYKEISRVHPKKYSTWYNYGEVNFKGDRFYLERTTSCGDTDESYSIPINWLWTDWKSIVEKEIKASERKAREDERKRRAQQEEKDYNNYKRLKKKFEG